MANSADPDQLASSEANWSGSALFVKAGYIRAQQDKGLMDNKCPDEAFHMHGMNLCILHMLENTFLPGIDNVYSCR